MKKLAIVDLKYATIRVVSPAGSTRDVFSMEDKVLREMLRLVNEDGFEIIAVLPDHTFVLTTDIVDTKSPPKESTGQRAWVQKDFLNS